MALPGGGRNRVGPAFRGAVRRTTSPAWRLVSPEEASASPTRKSLPPLAVQARDGDADADDTAPAPPLRAHMAHCPPPCARGALPAGSARDQQAGTGTGDR